MTWKTKTAVGAGLAIVAVFATVKFTRRLDAESAAARTPVGRTGPEPRFLNESAAFSTPPEAKAPPARGLSTEKKARLAQIRRDYEEMRTKLQAEFVAESKGNDTERFKAHFARLVLLEREMKADLAKALTPEEFEDYEMSESATGKAVRTRWVELGLTDEQQRLVFRAQREFDERYALTFDMAPAALLERMKASSLTQEKIHTVLGDETYAKWLQIEEPAYRALLALAQNQGLPLTTVNAIWRIKDQWTLGKLEIVADPRLAGEQRTAMLDALAEQTRSRVLALMGDATVQSAAAAFDWLPPRP